ncbi:suppressor protein stp22 of temperature-sensitive alpha-factor receptor and arginine permease, partial [Linderina pennispora]
MSEEGFADSQKAFTQFTAIRDKYPLLFPAFADYVYENGRRQGLLCFHGTIPVPYHGAVFNIPVKFWFPLEFPTHRPMCYVTPTPAMIVKAGKYVDDKCKIYHPYLASWSSESVTVELIAQLIKVFSVEPPVYARTTEPPSQMVMQPAKKPESAFVRPMSAVESELAGVTAAAASISVDSAQHGLANNTAIEAHPSYKFNSVPGRPPIPSLSPPTAQPESPHVEPQRNSVSSEAGSAHAVAQQPASPVVSQQAVQPASPVVSQQAVQPASPAVSQQAVQVASPVVPQQT